MQAPSTLFSAILRVGFPLHKPYPYSLYRWVPPFYVPEMFADMTHI